MTADAGKQSFWDHLDVLRTAIVRIVAVAVVFGIAAFCFKEQLFAVVLAPKDDGFLTYRIFDRIALWMGSQTGSFAVELINTGLAQQFIIHMKTALCAGVLCASPYIIYQLYATLSETRHRDNSRYCGHHYTHFGCIYALARCITDVGAV